MRQADPMPVLEPAAGSEPSRRGDDAGWEVGEDRGFGTGGRP
jgi:hypothetical protein